MYDINLDPNCMPNFSYLQALEEASSESSGACGSQPCMSCVSVQTLKSPLPNYVSQPDAVQNNAYSGNPLNQYVVASRSESNFISTYNLVDFTPDELDMYFAPKETASDELIPTELNPPTDTSNPLQGACGKTSVNFSQSSPPPVAIFNPQQKAQTEAESDNPLLPSSKGKAARKEYHKSPARQAARKEYEQTPARKAARKEYQKSPARKAARKEYEQSPAGKVAKARAQAKYQKSPAGKAARARADAKYRKFCFWQGS